MTRSTPGDAVLIDHDRPGRVLRESDDGAYLLVLTDGRSIWFAAPRLSLSTTTTKETHNEQ